VASGEEDIRPVVSVYTSERLYDLLCALHVSYDDCDFHELRTDEMDKIRTDGGAKLLLSQPFPPRASAAMLYRWSGTKSFPITPELSVKTGVPPVLHPWLLATI